MAEEKQSLDINPQERALIEAALHTQAKILNVQASAGGNAARQRLNEVKRVLARIDQQKPGDTRARCNATGWRGMARIFG
jgi:hypothetical protein